MKKVRITESQLRGIVRRMISEDVETKYTGLAKKGFNPQEIQNIKNNFSAVQILNKMDLNRDIINSDKPTIHAMLLQPDKVKMGTTTIGESQLKGIVKKMIREEVSNQLGFYLQIGEYHLKFPSNVPQEIAKKFQDLSDNLSKQNFEPSQILNSVMEAAKTQGIELTYNKW